MTPTLANAAAGFASGTTATAAMSGFMRTAQKLGLMERMPPRRITATALDALGIGRSRREEQAASMGAHFSFGAGAGAVFALVARRPSSLGRSVIKGALFGSLVWAVSYAGWVPALGVLPAPTRDWPGRQWSMFLAHLVYGGVLGASLERRREKWALPGNGRLSALA